MRPKEVPETKSACGEGMRLSIRHTGIPHGIAFPYQTPPVRAADYPTSNKKLTKKLIIYNSIIFYFIFLPKTEI
ncbi:hypothetical protein DJ52_00580 [Brachyspira murdochii]|uniref:Uncharacterized protein n=1 Tax=Brachyspira murdochii TaxID=84378 RepID=A0ABX5B7D6_9SPIR|nr:hypothetical protein DJ52_00580 [Brachyspira murdochii]